MIKQIGLKNTTLTNIELLEIGETVPVSIGSPELILDVSNIPAVDLRRISTLQPLINSGDIVVFDGVKDLGIVDGYGYLISDVSADGDGFWYTNRRRFTIKVKQLNHLFKPGEVVYIEQTGAIVRAIATSHKTSSTAFVVQEIIDTEHFYAATLGAIVTPDPSVLVYGTSLVVGAPYFLTEEQNKDGMITTIPPSNPGEIVKLIGVAISSTELSIFNQAGYENETALSAADITSLQEGSSIIRHSIGWFPAVLDIVNDPSILTPTSGDRYIVGTGVGDWVGKDNNIAEYNTNSSSWYFTIPEDGNFTYDKTQSQLIKFDGAAWIDASLDPAIDLQDDGVDVINTPHTKLNFVEMDISDNGNGTANIQNVFGSHFQKAESLGVSTTLSSTAITKVSMTTPALPIGTYRIGVSYGWNHDAITSDFEAWLNEDAVQKGEIHKQEPKDSIGSFGSTGTSQRYYISRVFYSTYASMTSHVFDLDFRTDANGVESSMWEASIEIYRVS